MSPTGFEKVHWHLSIVCLAKSPRYHSRRRISSANHTSCPRSAVIVQCDRALGRNACGTVVARYKNWRPPRRTNFFALARAFAPKPHAHCAVAVLGGQRTAGIATAAPRARDCATSIKKAAKSHHQRLLLHRFHLLLQHLHLAFPVVAAAKPGEVDGEGGGGPAAGRSPESPKQIQLNTVGCPSRHARAKEVGILRPHRATNRHCAGKYRPVLGIP